MRWAYGWNIVAAAMVYQAFAYGTIISSFTLFLPFWSADFAIAKSTAAFFVTVSTLLGGFAGAAIGPLFDRFSVRLLMLIGALRLMGNPNLAQSNQPVLIAATIGLVLLVVGGLQAACGFHLRRLRPLARIPVGIISALGLLAIPLGTLINGYILYLLFSKKGRFILSPEYQAIVAATPEIKYRTSIVIWILLGLVLVFIVGAIGASTIFGG